MENIDSKETTKNQSGEITKRDDIRDKHLGLVQEEETARQAFLDVSEKFSGIKEQYEQALSEFNSAKQAYLEKRNAVQNSIDEKSTLTVRVSPNSQSYYYKSTDPVVVRQVMDSVWKNFWTEPLNGFFT